MAQELDLEGDQDLGGHRDITGAVLDISGALLDILRAVRDITVVALRAGMDEVS